jgi:P4 family phage/plasmid primase-like protien
MLSSKPASGTTSNTNRLQQFLRSHSTTSKDEYTHVRISGKDGNTDIRGGKFVIDTTSDKFAFIYDSEVFGNKVHEFLAERISDQDVTPVKMDLDLHYLVDEYKTYPPRIYTENDIRQICQHIIEALSVYIRIEDLHDEDRECFVMEKPNPSYVKDKNGVVKKNENNRYFAKDGIHLVFPRICTSPYIQHLMRVNFIQRARSVFEPFQLIKPMEETVDEAVIETNPWQVYGSRKPGSQPYQVTIILRTWSDKTEEVEDTYSTMQKIKLLGMRNKSQWPNIREDKEAIIVNQINQNKKDKENRTRNSKTQQSHVRCLSENEIELVSKLIGCLDTSRAREYMKWIQLGWCLYNIHNKDDRVLKMWVDFSKKASEYAYVADDVCRERWANMQDSTYSLGSLKYWANTDNPTEYKKIIMSNSRTHLLRLLKKGKKVTEYEIAEFLYMLHKDEYLVRVGASANDMCFKYEHSKHRWIEDEKSHLFTRVFISNGIMVMFNELRKEFTKIAYDYKMSDRIINEDSDNDDDEKNSEDEQKAIEKKVKNAEDIIEKLQRNEFKSAIVKASKEFFSIKGQTQVEKLDGESSFHIIGFSNGIYDLKNSEFRDGRPEDLNTLSTNIEYVEYDENHPIIQDIYEFFEQVFIIKSVRRYMLKLLASYIDGLTVDEIFSIFSGKGGNGKSKMISLLQKALGFHISPSTSYVGKMTVSVITEKRPASTAATPEVAKNKGKRFCSMEEPDRNDQLNAGFMKELTGGDAISARKMYQDPLEFKPQFKLALICNDKPEIKSGDEGTWRRVRNTDFLSTFTASPKPENILHFKRCVLDDAKLNEWAPYFMSILIHWYPIYKKEGIKDDSSFPDEIIGYTQEYRSSNDQFNLFMESIMDVTINVEDERTLPMYPFNSLYRQIYIPWTKENNIVRKDFIKIMQFKTLLDEKFYNNLSKGQWIKIKNYRIPLKSEYSEYAIMDGDIFDDRQSTFSQQSNRSGNSNVDPLGF